MRPTARRHSVLAALFLIAAAASGARAQALPGNQLTRETRQAICSVIGQEWGGGRRHLTGSVIYSSADGSSAYAMTNHHLWTGPGSVQTVYVGIPGDQFYPAKTVFSEEATDVCVLTFSPGKQLPYLSLAAEDETVDLRFCGYPGGATELDITPCSLKAELGGWRILDAYGAPGHSGSPVLNAQSQIVGQVWGGDETGEFYTSLEQLRDTFRAVDFHQFCVPGYTCQPQFLPPARRSQPPARVRAPSPQPAAPAAPDPVPPPAAVQACPPVDYDQLLLRISSDPRFTAVIEQIKSDLKADLLAQLRSDPNLQPPTADQIAKKVEGLGQRSIDTMAIAEAVQQRLPPYKIGLTDADGQVRKVLTAPHGGMIKLPPTRLERYDSDGAFLNADVQVLGDAHRTIRRPIQFK